MDPTLAVLISFMIFGGVAYYLGYRRSVAALDHKIATIRQTLEDADLAKDAAAQALYEEHRRQGEISEEIDLILKRAEEQTVTLRQKTLQDIDKIIKNRHQETEEMMGRLYQESVQVIQEKVTETVLTAIESFVATKFSDTQHEALNDTAIAQITAEMTGMPAAHKTKAKRLKQKQAR